MTEKTNPEDLLDFPCQYQFKVVGVAGNVFEDSVVAAISQHVTVITDSVLTRPSGKGNYQSVSVLVTLSSYEQLTSIYTELRPIDGLKMLL